MNVGAQNLSCFHFEGILPELVREGLSLVIAIGLERHAQNAYGSVLKGVLRLQLRTMKLGSPSLISMAA